MNYAEDNKNPFSQDEFSTQAHFPQFETSSQNIHDHIEAAKSNGWGAQIGNFINSRKKRVALIAAIIILFAGGSYLSSYDDAEPEPDSRIASIQDRASSDNASKNSGLGIAEIDKDKINVLDIKINNDGEVTFEEEKSAQDNLAITKTATPGDGITHLARSAIKDYLSQAGKNLNAEQKIYAEDYAQNKIGNERLEVGQKLSFSKELLAEAIGQSEQLLSWQIENLKQYSSTVSLL